MVPLEGSCSSGRQPRRQSKRGAAGCKAASLEVAQDVPARIEGHSQPEVAIKIGEAATKRGQRWVVKGEVGELAAGALSSTQCDKRR